MLLVRRDFVTVYKQTILGPIWFFLQPLLTTLMFTLIFGRVAKLPTDGVPHVLFYLSGITIWNFFAESLTKTALFFKEGAGIFTKVYYPRLVNPVSTILSTLLKFGVQFLLFLFFIVFYAVKGAGFNFTWALVLFPLVVILLAGLALGAGLFISAFTIRYRDLTFLIAFAVQLAMFATTVVYPLSIANSEYRWIIEANPVTPLIETFRFAFLGKGSFSWSSLAYASACTIFFLFVGLVTFNRAQRNFIDTV